MKTDTLHYAILNELQLDARMSNAEIGRKVGLTAPAVAARIRQMREEGIIKGFTTTIDFMRLDYQQKVVVAVQLPHGSIPSFLQEVKKMTGVTHIEHTTGEYCFFISLVVRSAHELNGKLNELGRFGQTTTFSVLSTPVDTKAIELS
ncbi:Lrp/AsnC family transcriptional regulator [Chitinophaga nivalis]|uniref:Lrp/AsnC family transcriptional regulator n=1 Tax=Chitinophaga nivalis TaxID=2991709 RepID=A0ABT3IKX8_9BACT|nr:Lrp/AsnC family transcriptional regulator [Chitinophaga nivalis]MCW3465690.1 Lrp/AsnC family transcriptional regulator [Chitinophaga nivalis]MCW3484619.1 Lrp/AsnC family transcriptional regulator [Chitinophaga nivalis]